MTQDQKDIFISVAQEGFACGLEHPLEWLMNYLLHASQIEAYDQVPRLVREVQDAFIAFFQGCGSSPDDSIETLDATGLEAMLKAHYQGSPLV